MENGGETMTSSVCLLTAADVKRLLRRKEPDYGREFTEQQWEDIAERLSALTRLIWQFANREEPD